MCKKDLFILQSIFYGKGMVDELEHAVEDPWAVIARHYKKERIEGMPKISVIVPCYNQVHILKDTLENLFNQKNVDIEIIIVDAGSSDSTFSYLQQHENRIARIYYVTKYNLPLMINKGVSLASGEYACFLFPGYKYHNPYSLCQIARVAHENLHPDFIYSADNHTEEGIKARGKAKKESTFVVNPSFTIYPFSRAYLKRGFLPTSPFCMWFRVEFYKEMGQLNYKYSFSKSVFDYLCRMEKKKDLHVATTYWTLTSSEATDKYVINMASLLQRFLLIIKYYGPLEGFLWFFRDKPIRLLSWSLKAIKLIFSPR